MSRTGIATNKLQKGASK